MTRQTPKDEGCIFSQPGTHECPLFLGVGPSNFIKTRVIWVAGTQNFFKFGVCHKDLVTCEVYTPKNQQQVYQYIIYHLWFLGLIEVIMANPEIESTFYPSNS